MAKTSVHSSIKNNSPPIPAATHIKKVGNMICYAFMQAVGMVNDHRVDCFRYGPLS
jgi:3-methyladenine DNA glycosylase Tag